MTPHFTLESRITGGVGMIGGLDIVIIINNRGGRGWNNRGLDGVEKTWFLSSYMLN